VHFPHRVRVRSRHAVPAIALPGQRFMLALCGLATRFYPTLWGSAAGANRRR